MLRGHTDRCSQPQANSDKRGTDAADCAVKQSARHGSLVGIQGAPESGFASATRDCTNPDANDHKRDSSENENLAPGFRLRLEERYQSTNGGRNPENHGKGQCNADGIDGEAEKNL